MDILDAEGLQALKNLQYNGDIGLPGNLFGRWCKNTGFRKLTAEEESKNYKKWKKTYDDVKIVLFEKEGKVSMRKSTNMSSKASVIRRKQKQQFATRQEVSWLETYEGHINRAMSEFKQGQKDEERRASLIAKKADDVEEKVREMYIDPEFYYIGEDGNYEMINNECWETILYYSYGIPELHLPEPIAGEDEYYGIINRCDIDRREKVRKWLQTHYVTKAQYYCHTAPEGHVFPVQEEENVAPPVAPSTVVEATAPVGATAPVEATEPVEAVAPVEERVAQLQEQLNLMRLNQDALGRQNDEILEILRRPKQRGFCFF